MCGQVTFEFVSPKPDGDARIQAFMDNAFSWYCKAMESTEDNSRYLYMLLTENIEKKSEAMDPMGDMAMNYGRRRPKQLGPGGAKPGAARYFRSYSHVTWHVLDMLVVG